MALTNPWGRFPPRTRYSGDQVPLPFVNGLDFTFEDKGATSVEISQPSDGLEKRQATIHLTFRPVEMKSTAGNPRLNREPVNEKDAVQPNAVLIFRGTGQRIPKSELAAYDKRVDVIFQPKAWVDRPTAEKIARGSLKKHFDEHHKIEDLYESTMQLLDNLDAQKNEEAFVGPLKEIGSEPFFYPGGETDALAPVDAGYGKDVKDEVGKELDKFLESEDNLDKWEASPGKGGLTAGDRRILMTFWVAEAKERVDKKLYSLWRYFEKTGGLMTVDGSGDEKIEMPKLPEGVDKFTFADVEAEKKEREGAAMWAASRVAKKMKI